MKLASGLILDQGLSSWTNVFFGMALSGLGTASFSAGLSPLGGLVASFSVLSPLDGGGTSFSVTVGSFVSAELFLRSYLL